MDDLLTRAPSFDETCKVFDKAKQRREERRGRAIEAVRRMREEGYFFQMQPVYVGRHPVHEVVFGDQLRPGTFEQAGLIAEAINMKLGKHGGIAGDPVQITVALARLIADWPDGLPNVYDEIRDLVASWRSNGADDAQIRVGLLRSDLLRDHNLDAGDVMVMLREEPGSDTTPE